jgi:hypothetical protein
MLKETDPSGEHSDEETRFTNDVQDFRLLYINAGSLNRCATSG